jgi:hypothetical protein
MSSLLKQTLQANRPNLSEKSIKAYTSTLKSLYKRVYPDDIKIDINKFSNDQESFLNHLKNIEFNKRKSILSALVVICGDNDCDAYRQLMNKDISNYNDQELNQEKSETQKANWVTQEDVSKVFHFYKAEADKLFKLKELTAGQFQTLQNYIILCLLSGQEGFPPRRALDYTEMKIRNYEKLIDNIFNGKEFIFNKYKTVKTYQSQEFVVPKMLCLILKKWVKINQNDYLLVDRKGEKLTPVTLNQRLNKIFGGKRVGVNILRHSYLTENTKSVTDLREIYERASEMGHSPLQALKYVKK